MVVAALLVRSRINDRNERRHTVLRLAGATELESVCDVIKDGAGGRVDLTVEPAGTTEARLAKAGDAGIDGWLAPTAWVGLVEDDRQRNQLPGRFANPAPILASSPLVIAMWADRVAAIRPACGGEVTWKCLGEQAAKNAVKPGHADPTTSATGLLVLGQAVASFFGRASLSTTDLDASDAFDGWFTGLEQAVPEFDDGLLDRMLAQGRSFLDAVGTIEAEAAPLLRRAARGSDVSLLYPSPMANAFVVLAPVSERPAAARLAALVRGPVGQRALARAGWHVPPASVPSGVPDPGLLDALRQRWKQVAR